MMLFGVADGPDELQTVSIIIKMGPRMANTWTGQCGTGEDLLVGFETIFFFLGRKSWLYYYMYPDFSVLEID